MANTQYLNYKNDFKKQCILNTIGGGLALLTIILLLFVQLFEIRVIDLAVFRFSLFDEIKLTFDTYKAASSANMSKGININLFMGIYQILAIVMFAIAICLFVVELIKNVTGILNMDTYSLDQYDKIKKRTDEQGKKAFKKFSALNMFVSGVILEVFYLFYSKYLISMLADTPQFSEQGIASYFASMTGVSGVIVVPILTAIGAIAANILRKMSISKTRAAILKEDYGITNENAPVAESAPTANVNAPAEIAPTESAPANTPNDNTPKE